MTVIPDLKKKGLFIYACKIDGVDIVEQLITNPVTNALPNFVDTTTNDLSKDSSNVPELTIHLGKKWRVTKTSDITYFEWEIWATKTTKTQVGKTGVCLPTKVEKGATLWKRFSSLQEMHFLLLTMTK